MSSQIPNIYRFLWSGANFPRLYSAALTSVLKVDLDARVTVYCFGDRPCSGDFTQATVDPRIDVVDIEPAAVFAKLPPHLRRVADAYHALPPTAASARSNLLRYAILYLEGGYYLDFDTITLRPLTDVSDAECFIGAERVWTLDEPRVAGDKRVLRSLDALAWLGIWVIKRIDSGAFRGKLRMATRTARFNHRFTVVQANNAVIGAVPGAEFLDRVLRGVLGADPYIRYSTGPTLVARVARTSPHLVDVLQPAVFYQVEPAESFRYFSDATLRLHPAAAVIHYVGSNSARFLTRDSVPRHSLISRVTKLLDSTQPSQLASSHFETPTSTVQGIPR